MLRAGVIGAGVFGGYHASKYVDRSDVSLTAIFDPDRTKAQLLATRNGAIACSSVDQLLELVDVVTIASPAGTHFEIARDALLGGRHVYVEKPLALEVDDAEALAALARERSRHLYVGHQERLVMNAVGAFARDDAPQQLEFARCGPPSGRCEEVSVVWDLMIHDLDLAACLIKSRPVSVAAAGDDHEVAATMEFANGSIASFFASRQSVTSRRSMRAAYDGAEYNVDFLTRTLCADHDGVIDHRKFAGEITDPLGAHVNAFIDAIHGFDSVGVNADEACQSVQLAKMIEQSRARLAAIPRAASAALPAEQERLSA